MASIAINSYLEVKEPLVFRQSVLLEEESLAHVTLEHDLASVLALVELQVTRVHKFPK